MSRSRCSRRIIILAKALGPYADVRQARADAPDPIGAMIDDGADVLILSDMAVSPRRA